MRQPFQMAWRYPGPLGSRGRWAQVRVVNSAPVPSPVFCPAATRDPGPCRPSFTTGQLVCVQRRAAAAVGRVSSHLAWVSPRVCSRQAPRSCHLIQDTTPSRGSDCCREKGADREGEASRPGTSGTNVPSFETMTYVVECKHASRPQMPDAQSSSRHVGP